MWRNATRRRVGTRYAGAAIPLREGVRRIGRSGPRVQQFAHPVAEAVPETLDLAGASIPFGGACWVVQTVPRPRSVASGDIAAGQPRAARKRRAAPSLWFQATASVPEYPRISQRAVVSTAASASARAPYARAALPPAATSRACGLWSRALTRVERMGRLLRFGEQLSKSVLNALTNCDRSTLLKLLIWAGWRRELHRAGCQRSAALGS
jgi:hypothetical protein